MSETILTIGTRASPLALAQSRHVAAALATAHGWSPESLKLEEIITEGDKRLDTTLAEIGGKGLFTEELEAGLLDGSLDMAVHSLKDLPTAQPDGLTLAAILPRAPSHDVLIARAGLAISSLKDLPKGARLGTSALRRRAQILKARPDLDIVALRGNVGTRLSKLKHENLDAIILAAAGLERLGLAPEGSVSLASDILPAAGQGALAVQCRANDTALIAQLKILHCADTNDCITAERSFLAALDGSCRTPIAAKGEIKGDDIFLEGRLLDDDGAWLATQSGTAARTDAAALGQQLAAKVAAQAAHYKD